MHDIAKTRYPIVLVPGLLGFVRLLGYPYWYGIEPALRERGAEVVALRVSAVNDSELRGEQVLGQIPGILEAYGASKVNLIGHSQGALSIRYAAAQRPEWVASVTSVAGPNQGSEVADYLFGHLRSGGGRERLATFCLQGVGRFLDRFDLGSDELRLPQDAFAAYRALTREGVAAFNEKYPQGLPPLWGGEGAEEVNGVRYYSWSGILQPGLTDSGRNRFDLGHTTCRRLSRWFEVEREENDGLVGRFSSHLGKVIRSDYPLDHLDIINQTAGAVGAGMDPVALFIEHAARLREAGL